MTRSIFAALIACLLAAAPADADVPPGRNPSVDLPTLAPVEDETTMAAIVLPLPWVALYGIGGIQNIKLGSSRHDLSFRGGYVWSTNTAFDPTSRDPKPIFPADDIWQPANFWHLYAAWGWRMAPRWTLFLDGYTAGGGLASTPGYDPTLTQGLSTMWGPLLDFNTLDHPDFPTRGFQAQLGWAPGYHWGAENLAFQKASLELRQHVPVGENQTIGARALAMAGWPRLAWVDKFYAGGAKFLRGYEWSRFTGDRLLSATVEYRNLFAPDLLSLVGVGGTGVEVGLAWELYADAGRAWESSVGVPFMSDLRYGAGTGLMLTINKAAVGRLELNVGPEGIFPVSGVGSSF